MLSANFGSLLSTHADGQGVNISFTVCFYVCVCLFVRLRISRARIKVEASNFARWFMGVLGTKSPIFWNFASPGAQNLTNRRDAANIADTPVPSIDGALTVSGGD